MHGSRMFPSLKKTQDHAGQPASKAPGQGFWATAMAGFGARLGDLARSLRRQGGFSLIESVAAVGVIGISVVGSVVLLSATVITSSETEGNLGLIEIVRAQIETIQQSPYLEDPTEYPLVGNIPPNVIVTISARYLPETTYTFPGPSGATLDQVLQEIEVTATQNEAVSKMTFYKVQAP